MITVTNVNGERRDIGSSGKYFGVGIDLKALAKEKEEKFADAPDIDSLVDGKVTEPTITRDELKDIATENGIEFKPNIKTEALRELVKDFI